MKKGNYISCMQYEGRSGEFYLDDAGNWTPNIDAAKRFESFEAAEAAQKAARQPRFPATFRTAITTTKGS